MKGLRVFALVLLGCGALPAQTSTTGKVIGTVSDPSGAVIVNANITLVDTRTNVTVSTVSNEAGQYTFASVLPGLYRLSASMAGFRQAVVQNVIVEVAKSFVIDLKMEVGATAETVEVVASGVAELQTQDSTVGAVIKGDPLLRMPAINRSAAALLTLQPMVTPSRGVTDPNFAGQVAGMRSDQNTFSLDGADATDLTSGTGGYFAAAIDWSGPTPLIPVPLESVEEFRVSTTNPNATFGRSAGGQVSMVTKRGTNLLHGSAYWYHQNDNLNANNWQFNRVGIKRPELKDNRFGTSLGGPLVKDKLFIFGHYEGRRFPRAVSAVRNVPSAELRQGILRFTDANGTINSYNIRNFDPRNRGLSPVISALWNKLPLGNDPTVGDGLNTLGFRGPVDNSVRMDFGVARMDYHFTGNWRLNSTYRYSTQSVNDIGQVDIAGLTGGASGQIRPGGQTPVEPRFFSTQLSGMIRPNLINEFNVGFSRNFWAYKRINPFPQVPGTSAALMVGQGTLDSGIDVDTQRARSRIWREQTYQINNNLSWIRGKHTLQFGGSFRHMPVFHERDDKVIGSLTTLVYEATAQNNAVSIAAANRPPSCGAGVTANCILTGDVARYNTLFAAGLGMIDKAGVVVTRDTDLNSQPLGTPMRINASFRSYEIYANDVWRVNPGLTITAGLTFSVQTPPVDRNSLQTLMLDAGTNRPIDVKTFFPARAAAAAQGQTFNPTITYQPIRNASQKYIYDIDWNNVGPRIAAAWNPSGGGLFGKLFGDRKSVLRAGYGVTFDRTNGVGVVMLPILGVGFSQTATCNGPRIDGTCANSSDATNAFRIGVDGATVPIPQLARPSIPVTPGISGETLSFAIDPKLRVGRSQSIDFTIQRELPKTFIVEAGYVARISSNLPQNYELNAVPLNFKDPASGQTFGQAFNAVADQVRSGVAANRVTNQPFFENQFRGVAACGASCTQYLAGARSTEFNQGALNGLTNFLNTIRPGGPFYNRQVINLFVRGSDGEAFYNAAFFTLTKRFSSGLTFTTNYTFSKTLDEYGLNQENIGVVSNPYDLSTDWGPAIFDRTHVFNGNYFYELPFGRGKRFDVSNPVADRVFGGWYLSGIFTASSGFPLILNQHGQAFGGAQLFNGLSPGMIPLRGGFDYSTTVNTNSRGQGTVGTSADPARRGSGMNIFSNPQAVTESVRFIRPGEDGRHGRGFARGLKRWNWDLSIGKKTTITERVKLAMSFDFINVLNRVEFADPSMSFFNPAAFGVITAQWATPRQVQFGFRVEF